MPEINCQYCNKQITKNTSDINRALKNGYKLFCSKRCSGLSHRKNKTKEQLIEEKRIYDYEYRQKNIEKIRIKKAKYFKKVYSENPEKFKQKRIEKREYHSQYCRSDEYRQYKKNYDRKFRAKKFYGEFWESAIILKDICLEIDRKQANIDNQTINKSIKRKRNINY